MAWKVGGIFFLVVAVFLWLMVLSLPEDLRHGLDAAAVVASVSAIAFLLRSSRLKAQRKKAESAARESFIPEQALNQIDNGILPQLSGVPVILGDGEVAHYYDIGCRYITKRKSVGRTGGGGGVSVRVAKGVSVRSGKSSSQTIYDDVTNSFYGHLILTNRRLVFVAEQNGFDCKLSAISAVAPNRDGLMIQSGSQNYRLKAQDQEHFEAALQLAIENEKRRIG